MMHLLIEDNVREFIPVQDFREHFDLPETFGIAMFEPKDLTGLGRIDSAGQELNEVRRAVLDAIPTVMPLQEWLAYLPNLSRLFENKLHEVNPEIGLKRVEIEYATSGFQDVCQSLIYALIQARSAGEPTPGFQQVYDDWLNSSVRIAATVHSYTYHDEVWPVQIVNTAYGRIGLVVWTKQETYYLQDFALGCPAEGFTRTLLGEVAARIIRATDEPSAN